MSLIAGSSDYVVTHEGLISNKCPAGDYVLLVSWWTNDREPEGVHFTSFQVLEDDTVQEEEVDEHSSQYVDYMTPEDPDPPAEHGPFLIGKLSQAAPGGSVDHHWGIAGLVPDSDPDTLDYIVSLRVVDNDNNPVANCNEDGVGGSYKLYTIPEDRGWGREVTLSALCMSGSSGAIFTLEFLNGSSELLLRVEDPLDGTVNNFATGRPTISGTAQVGETLTADTSGIADFDGLTNAVFSHQWLADDTAIQGATGSTYTLADADEGKAITVKVSFTDDRGNDESLTSEATDTVAAAPAPNNRATRAPTIIGTAQVGKTLKVDTSGIADVDGLDNAAFAYQWLADDTAIQGATGSTYTLAGHRRGQGHHGEGQLHRRRGQ